jgi:Uma2 family endonuclease
VGLATELDPGRRPWTLEELQRLPDDGNKYELIDGELYVTPSPADRHEEILARLTRLLDPFVAEHGLGLVYHARAVIRHGGSEVEPDLFVRAPKAAGTRDWDDAPTPLLVVEVLSPYTRSRDFGAKREFYARAGIPEYWVVDPLERQITRIRSGSPDEVATDRLLWKPTGVEAGIVVAIDDLMPATA